MTSKRLLAAYLEDLYSVAQRGDAREESYYSSLERLLDAFAAETGRTQAHVTTLPKKTEAGNPDFRVWDGRQHITGYLEAKAPATDLDAVAKSEQLSRYRETFPNLILTDFCDFRLYRDGDCILAASAGRSHALVSQKRAPSVQESKETKKLLETFFQYSLPRSYDAESLAVALARRTRFLRNVVREELEKEIEAEAGKLLGFYEAFQEYLIAGLTPLDFSDLYSQTLTYGLFAARIRAGDEFTRRTAVEHIPRSIGILHEIFKLVSYGKVPEPLEWLVDDIAEVLAVADVGGILDRYYREGKGTDPVVHFYEPFLTEYDPEQREQRGVYYTPEPVVSYIVRSLHHLLKDRFGKADGLASNGVTLLDPAAGTMTFVARATREAVDEYAGKYGRGAVEGFLTDHVLENFYAFELMMAPYAVGHLKMTFFLEELGHRLHDDERFQLYLTNTLEMEELAQTQMPFARALSEESQRAGKVKKETPILVILGNPPYSGHSFNPSWKTVPARGKDGTIKKRKDGSIVKRRVQTFIGRLIDHYKQVDGRPLGERNPKWLQDDYVKFLRFAEWKISQEEQGLVGMITNHSWLDNPTFRGMRWHLLTTYDQIWILDLHGNSLKRESAPDGGPDENVFDIRQGVAITFFLKHAGGSENDLARVRHADLWGRRAEKYDWLKSHDVARTGWTDVTPRREFYLFVPRDEATLERYNEFPRVTDLFPVNSVGIVTSRDRLVIDFEKPELQSRIAFFRDRTVSDQELRKHYDLRDTADFTLSKARRAVQSDDKWEDRIVRILYRPFDERYLFYHSATVERGRDTVMRHMLAGENLALVTNRQVRGVEAFCHALVSTRPTDLHVLETAHAAPYHFPLYIYPEAGASQIAHLDDDGERKPNLAPRLLTALRRAYGARTSPEEVFHYVYAVLYASSYREKYADFLKVDFPRIPFTTDPELFAHLARLGGRVAGLHLLESSEVDRPVAQFHGEGRNEVVRRKSDGFRYDPEQERKYINEKQYFAPVPLELWEYHIGGYQVLHKWLKDRKGRKLSADEIRTYCRIVTAIQRTVEVQEEIDALYPDLEADVVKLDLGEG